MLGRIKNFRGDTIVEVLLALAILSLAFVISYATANRALTDSQNSQEHTLALEYLDSQLEALRYLAGQQTPALSPGSHYLVPDLASHSVLIDPAPGSEPGNGFTYSVAIISLSSDPNTYHAVVSWPGLGNLGTQSEELSYRVY